MSTFPTSLMRVRNTADGAVNTNLGGTQNNYHAPSQRVIAAGGVVNVYEALQAETLSPAHTVPYIRDGSFVDRQEMGTLEDLMLSGARVAIFGLGGVGKSQLAIEHCYRVRDKAPDTWVFWIHCSNAERFDADLRKLARTAHVVTNEDVGLHDTIETWLRTCCKSWLVVLDNADEADFLFESTTGQGQRRISCFPPCSGGSVLVTTRNRAIAARLVDARNIILLNPTAQFASELVRSRLVCSDDEGTVLARALDNMPLAISQAAAFINKNSQRGSITTYLRRLEASSASRERLLRVAQEEHRRDFDAKDSILLTWHITFDHLRTLHPAAANLLSLMSFYHPQGIPDVLLMSTDHDDELDAGDEADLIAFEHLDDGLAVLAEYSLIAASRSTVQVHSLVQLATQAWLKSCGEYDRWEILSIDRLLNSLPNFSTQQHEMWNQLSPHVKVVMQSKSRDDAIRLRLAQVASCMSGYAHAQEFSSDAQAYARWSYDARLSILGDCHELTLDSSLAMAVAMKGCEGSDVTLNRVRRVVAITASTLGQEHYQTWKAKIMLLNTFTGHHLDEAEALMRSVLDNDQRVKGNQHPQTVFAAFMLMLILVAQDKQPTEEESLRFIYDLSACEQFGRGFEADCVHTEEDNWFIQLMAMAEMISSKSSSQTLELVRQRLLDEAQAVRLARSHVHESVNPSTRDSPVVYSICQTLKPKIHAPWHMTPPPAPTAYEESESIRAYLSKLDHLERYTRFAIAIMEQLGAEKFAAALRLVHVLGWLLEDSDRVEQAIHTFRQVLMTQERVLGLRHPHTLKTMLDLGRLRRPADEVDPAEATYARLFPMMQLDPRDRDPLILDVANDYALLQSSKDMHANAAKLHHQIMLVDVEEQGRDHEVTLYSMHRTGVALYLMRSYTRAETILRDAWAGRDMVLGPLHRQTLASLLELIWTVNALDKTAEHQRLVHIHRTREDIVDSMPSYEHNRSSSSERCRSRSIDTRRTRSADAWRPAEL